MESSSEQREEIDDKRFQLIGVPSSSVEEIWPRAEHLIKKGLEHGRGELDATDVLNRREDEACDRHRSLGEDARL